MCAWMWHLETAVYYNQSTVESSQWQTGLATEERPKQQDTEEVTSIREREETRQSLMWPDQTRLTRLD